MELKQLEYFVVTCEKGSFNQAAECLYTTQPNVSKVIGALENELGRKLFERTSRGIRITPYGEMVREHAQNILKSTNMIGMIIDRNTGNIFRISAYPSNMISMLLTEFYQFMGEKYTVEHQEGTVEEIVDRVSKGMSEIGIIYVARKQLQAFQHILSHKKLKFEVLDEKEACIYVGSNHPLYREESIDFSKLSELNFVRGVKDFFSMDLHLKQISLGALSTEELKYAMYTNSNHLMLNLLLYTDICSIGIDFIYPPYAKYDIKALRINHCEPFLSIGYIYPEEGELSQASQWFLERFKKML